MDLLAGGKCGLWLNEKRQYYRQFPSQIARERERETLKAHTYLEFQLRPAFWLFPLC